MPPIIHRVHSHSESNTANKMQLLSMVKYVIPNLSSPCSLSLSMIKNEHIPSFCRFNNHLVCSTKLDYDNCYKCSPKKTLKRRRKEPLTLAKHSRQASRGQETWGAMWRAHQRSFLERRARRDESRRVPEGPRVLVSVLGVESTTPGACYIHVK